MKVEVLTPMRELATGFQGKTQTALSLVTVTFLCRSEWMEPYYSIPDLPSPDEEDREIPSAFFISGTKLRQR